MANQLDDLKNLISQTPRGAVKISLLYEAINLASSMQDWKSEISLRFKVIQEEVLFGDHINAIIMFPKYTAIVDQHIDEISVKYHSTILWAFKHVIENTILFHQISWSQLIELLEEFRQRCLQYGYSLRYYYVQKIKYAIYLNKYEEAKHFYRIYKTTPRDSVSDCLACEIDFEVSYLLNIDKYEEALKVARPLFMGEKSCTEVPNITYPKFLLYLILNKKSDKVDFSIEKAYKLIYKNKVHLRYLEGFLLYYSELNIKEGLKIFTNHLNWALNSRNDEYKFKFYLASWIVFEKLQKNKIKLKLPDKFPLYNKSKYYQKDHLINYLKEQVIEIAEKFDERDQGPYHSNYIQKITNRFLKD